MYSMIDHVCTYMSTSLFQMSIAVHGRSDTEKFESFTSSALARN